MSAWELSGVPVPGEWAERGACRGAEVDEWFPRRGEPADVATAVCETCPVLGECRAFGLAWPALQGIWGGMGQQARLRATGRRSAPRARGRPPVEPCGTEAAHRRHIRAGKAPCRIAGYKAARAARAAG